MHKGVLWRHPGKRAFLGRTGAAVYPIAKPAFKKNKIRASNPGDSNTLLVAMWRVDGSDDVLVTALGNGDVAASLFSSLEHKGMTAVAFDGNDNGPHQVWEDGQEEVKPERLARILEATVIPEVWEEVREVISESHPKVARKLKS